MSQQQEDPSTSTPGRKQTSPVRAGNSWLVRLSVICGIASQVSAQDISMYQPQISASATATAYTVYWAYDPGAVQYQVFRKNIQAAGWNQVAQLDGSFSEFRDIQVSPGELIDYKVTAYVSGARAGLMAPSFIRVGYQVPLIDDRGKILVLVDSQNAPLVSAELDRFVSDLTGDGWSVVRTVVNRAASPPEVKAIIKAAYDADPARLRSVLLLGRIAVPYSGTILPDGHGDHYGAWPADVYYGEVEGSWTDSSANVTTSRVENRNIPGDGKFDQSVPPKPLKLAVGRVDLSNMSSFGKTEDELLRQYLRKNHEYRHGRIAVRRSGLVDDHFGMSTYEPFALNGWGNFRALVGSANTFTGAWKTDLPGVESWLLAYGCGPGSFTSVGGVASTSDFATLKLNAIFTMLFGSYFGDWDNSDNVLRAPLASEGSTLVCAWAGRPDWNWRPMATGETIGACTLLTQNDTMTFNSAVGGNQVHVALMGDPTLRLYPVRPVEGLSATRATGGGANLNWQASPDASCGYHVYIGDSFLGPFKRATSEVIGQTNFTYTGLSEGKTFMVRAIKLETTPSGSFYNPSQGVFCTAEIPPTVTLSVSQANAAELYAVPGTFLLSRSGPIDAALTVNVAYAGSAQNGGDYQTLPSQIVIPAGSASITLSVIPNEDALAEGTETVLATVSPGTAYTVGPNNQASVQIADRPFDAWRFEHFTQAQLADPSISGPTGDANGNGLSNLLDYAFLSEVQAAAALAAPVVSTGGSGSQRFLKLAYRRNHAATDLEFVVELADSLFQSAWVSGDDLTTILSTTDNGDGSDTVVVRENRTIGSDGSRFIRLKVRFR